MPDRTMPSDEMPDWPVIEQAQDARIGPILVTLRIQRIRRLPMTTAFRRMRMAIFDDFQALYTSLHQSGCVMPGRLMQVNTADVPKWPN